MKVLFNLKYHCGFGQHLAMVGNQEKLGKWDVSKCVKMEWSEGDVWVGQIDIDPS